MDDYQLEVTALGSGAFATVYKAQGPDFKVYAIKVFFWGDKAKDRAIQNAKAESIAKTLDHKSIYKVYEVKEEAMVVMDNKEKKPCSYVVMELLHKHNL